MNCILVVDASIVVDLLGRFHADPIERLLWADDVVLAAPELMYVEVLNTLRKLERNGVVPEGRMATLPSLLRGLRIHAYGHANLLDAIWATRHNLTAYDAANVALARLLGGSLLTRDSRMAHAADLAFTLWLRRSACAVQADHRPSCTP